MLLIEEMLDFFLVANDETRKNVTTLIRNIINKIENDLHVEKLSIQAM